MMLANLEEAMGLGEISGIVALQFVLAFLATWIREIWTARIARNEQAALDQRLSQLEVRLRRQELEHEVQFRRVDQKVADVLSQTYELLHDLYEGTTRYLDIFGSDYDLRLEKVDQANKKFCAYFFPKRLYVPPDLYRRTKQFYDRLIDSVDEFTRKRRADARGELDEPYWSTTLGEIGEMRDSLFKDIVTSFQQRLGVKD